jgi:hypothetical protein
VTIFGSTLTIPTVHTTRAGRRVALRDLAERERGLRRGEERVAPHRIGVDPECAACP